MSQLEYLLPRPRQKSGRSSYSLLQVKSTFTDAIILSVNFSPFRNLAEVLLMTTQVGSCTKSVTTWSTAPSCPGFLSSLTSTELLYCFFFRFSLQIWSDNLYSFILPDNKSISLITFYSSLSSSCILVFWTTGAFKPPRAPPKDFAAVCSSSDCTINSSSLWALSSTVLRPDTCPAIFTVPLDSHPTYQLPGMYLCYSCLFLSFLEGRRVALLPPIYVLALL